MRLRRVVAASLFALGVLALVAFFRTRVPDSKRTEDERRLAALRESPEPVIRDFANGAFTAGTTVEDLIAKHPAPFLVRHGRYTDLSYGDAEPGALWAFARDGRLYYAVSTGSGADSGHCFFCTASEEELTDRQRSFERYRFGNCFQAVLGPAAVARELTRE